LSSGVRCVLGNWSCQAPFASSLVADVANQPEGNRAEAVPARRQGKVAEAVSQSLLTRRLIMHISLAANKPPFQVASCDSEIARQSASSAYQAPSNYTPVDSGVNHCRQRSLLHSPMRSRKRSGNCACKEPPAGRRTDTHKGVTRGQQREGRDGGSEARAVCKQRATRAKPRR
jgi:hypothetical protein